MALGSAAVEIMRAKLSCLQWSVARRVGVADRMSWAIPKKKTPKGSLFLSLYLCCLAPVQICAVHVLYLSFSFEKCSSHHYSLLLLSKHALKADTFRVTVYRHVSRAFFVGI